MKGNEDKCHVVLNAHGDIHVKIGTSHVKNSCSKRLLGVKINSGLNFLEQISSICKKASAKLNPLASISPYIDERKRQLVTNHFFHFQCNYYPLVWMFHSRELNIKINRLHKQSLRIVYNDS